VIVKGLFVVVANF